jgi:cephalosporin hydroxylase
MSTNPITAFEQENAARIAGYPAQQQWQDISRAWMAEAFKQQYMYHFAWMGRPIIQTPTDMVALQEIIWQVKPDLIIETGITHGGSLIFSASQLALLDVADAAATGASFNPKQSPRKVLGIDIDIRAHNRAAINAHPLASYLEMIEGSSVDARTITQVKAFAANYKTILLLLDSNHTHDHVMQELAAYAPLVTVGSYCVVYDSAVEDMPEGTFPDRPWSHGNNPKTAIHEFLRTQGTTPNFTIDAAINTKLMTTAAPDGWLKRIA